MRNKFEIQIIKETKERIFFDFFIDEVQLSKCLGFDRIIDLEFFGFDLDFVAIDKEQFPNYNQEKIIAQAVNGFLGRKVPCNQFDSGRAVLYRCHCGCDYCGVISCQIIFDGDFVYWKDIRYECDECDEHEDIKPIDFFKFKQKEYVQAFVKYKEVIEKK